MTSAFCGRRVPHLQNPHCHSENSSSRNVHYPETTMVDIAEPKRRLNRSPNFSTKAPSTLFIPISLVIFISLFVHISSAMRLDPERLAARLRIEQEIEMDHRRMGRNRRQLGTPKEETIQVTAQLFSGRLFEYGTDEAGDKSLPSSLDVGKKLSLTRPISFYGKEYNTIYVLSNGGIGFDSNSRTYRANVLPSNLKIIAPFWNRNDLRNGGNVFYREVTCEFRIFVLHRSVYHGYATVHHLDNSSPATIHHPRQFITCEIHHP
ncbi:dendrite extension defective protein 1 [Ditylenchus destructor]|uniref:Dendrite extension defective protein 1 n=1 Tax=Ditylenchus destructor TaxID=166010 RepID=A0AAD4N560_9BILA|nr:dendrite extension defective protein 1 [Ditylenchus destructor]